MSHANTVFGLPQPLIGHPKPDLAFPGKVDRDHEIPRGGEKGASLELFWPLIAFGLARRPLWFMYISFLLIYLVSRHVM